MNTVIYKIIISLSFVAVFIINTLANTLPLNQKTTGEISNQYPSLFTPAGFTFSIWGIIYLCVGIWVVQMIFMQAEVFNDHYSQTFLLLFVFSCFLNGAWLFFWHYEKIGLSLIVMVLFLITLGIMTFILKDGGQLTKITFGIYAGWISIAFIANISIFIVKNKMSLFIAHELIWYILVMIIGVVIAITILFLTHHYAYVGVFIWAYFGIFYKHYTKSGYVTEHNLNVFHLILIGTLILLTIYDVVKINT